LSVIGANHMGEDCVSYIRLYRVTRVVPEFNTLSQLISWSLRYVD